MIAILKQWRLILAVGAIAGAAYLGHEYAANQWRVKYKSLEMSYAEAVQDAEAAEKARRVEQARLQVALAELELERMREAEVVERTITNEVIKYVEVAAKDPDPPRCIVGAKFMYLYDSAATGQVPEAEPPAAAVDAAAGGITDAAILRVTTDNFAACRRNAARLREIQQDLLQQQATYDMAF